MQDKINYWQEETKKYTWKHARILLIADEINHNRSVHSVLDLGAGEALLFRLLDQRIAYRGLDIAGEKNGALKIPPVDYFDFDHMDGNVEIPGIPYDCVVISGLLEYLENWEDVVLQVHKKWLKPGGLCLVSFINSSGYQKNAPVKGHPKWIHKFNLPGVLEKLDGMGFEVERVYPIFWGSKRWLKPVIRLWAEFAVSQRDFLLLDKPWVSQYLLRTVSKTSNETKA